MAQLKTQRGGRMEAIPLGTATTVGSGSGCQVVAGGAQASHCRLIRTDRGYLLEDLNTQSGTAVNGKRVSSQLLQNGDKIQVGSSTFVFEEEPRTGTRAISKVPAMAVAAPKPSPAKRETSRVIKKSTTRSIPVQRGGRSADEGEEDFAPPPPPPEDKTKLYLIIGGCALLLIILVAVAMSGGGEKSGGDHTREFHKAMADLESLRGKSDYQGALNKVNDILADPRFKKCDGLKDCERIRASLQNILNMEVEGDRKAADIESRWQKAVSEGAAMSKAVQFLDEVNDLIGRYLTTRAGKRLKDLKETIQRCTNTEAGSDWQKDYNPTKKFISERYVDTGNFAEAVRQWRSFGEKSTQPELHSRIEQEIREVNMKAKEAAEKLVAEAAGPDARSKLEEACATTFAGTDGQAVIRKKLSGK